MPLEQVADLTDRQLCELARHAERVQKAQGRRPASERLAAAGPGGAEGFDPPALDTDPMAAAEVCDQDGRPVSPEQTLRAMVMAGLMKAEEAERAIAAKQAWLKSQAGG